MVLPRRIMLKEAVLNAQGNSAQCSWKQCPMLKETVPNAHGAVSNRIVQSHQKQEGSVVD